MDLAAAAQWQGQQHLLCLLPSAAEAEPHYADLMLSSPMVTVIVREEVWQQTTFTGGVVVVAVVE